MIRYALRCSRGHEFESWFQSAAAFDRLAAAGRLGCATCGVTEVGKALMAPAVRTPEAAPAPASPAPGGTAERPLGTPRDEFERMLAAFRRHVEENADYVGLDFATEVREMHEGRATTRAVWGEARVEEARALVEDGIPVAPLPFRPRRSSN